MIDAQIDIANLNFLVAEDHEFQRRELVRMLQNLGATAVSAAADGRAALDLMRSAPKPFDIVVSDLNMPGMDGMEFIRHLGEARATVSLVIASALERPLISSIETMSAAYGIRVLGVIEKPATPRKLSSILGRHAPAVSGPARTNAAVPEFSPGEIADGLARLEFEPYFQPKVDLRSGVITGMEALARWRHPQKGIVAPAAYVNIMEANGLIDDLTWLILSQSAASCAGWRAAGLDATVSVNLSLKSLSNVSLADRVTALVRSQDLEPRHMILEVTETAATTDLGRSLENLARLRMNKFGLSIDDYGTGYSSMQQLMRIAFTELKIDRSFVTRAAEKEATKVILASSLDMARKLNITSVAEGVESRGDWNLLCELGCDVGQGYFISRPMPADEVVEWSLEWVQRNWE